MEEEVGVVQIKVEPDFYFPEIGESYDDSEEEDEDNENEDSSDYQLETKEALIEQYTTQLDDDRKGFRCNVCHKILKSSSHLMGHIRTHTGEKPFKCDICDKSFSESSSLKVHMRVHTGEKPFECKVCGRRFTQSCNLQSHIRRAFHFPGAIAKRQERQERQAAQEQMAAAPTIRIIPKLLTPVLPKPGNPFKCCVCEEPFFDQELLKIHEETHAPETPFKCKYCFSMFSMLKNFRAHINRHLFDRNIFVKGLNPNSNANPTPNSNPNLNPNSNLVRNGLSTTQGTENKHTMTQHLQQRLQMLANQRPNLSNLRPILPNTNNQRPPPAPQPPANNKIVVTENTERPYQCLECKQNFPKNELYHHMKIHLQQKNIFQKKRYECPTCSKIFGKSYNLKRHMLTHNKQIGPVVINTNSLSNSAVQVKVNITPEVDLLRISRVAEKPTNGNHNNNSNSNSHVTTTLTNGSNNFLNKILNLNDGIKIAASSSASPLNQSTKKAPILININTDEDDKSQPLSQTSSNGDGGKTKDGGFVISSVASVDRNYLQKLDELSAELVNKKKPTSSSDEKSSKIGVIDVKKLMQQNTNPFECPLCHKIMSEAFSLKVHMRTHTGEKPFKCKICNKRFTQSCNLNTHMRIHTGVKPFTCVVCFKSFTRSASLNGHMASHTYGKIKCVECGNIFINAYNYTIHIERSHPDFMSKIHTYKARSIEKFYQQQSRLAHSNSSSSEASGSDRIPKLKIKIKQERYEIDNDQFDQDSNSNQNHLNFSIKPEKFDDMSSNSNFNDEEEFFDDDEEDETPFANNDDAEDDGAEDDENNRSSDYDESDYNESDTEWPPSPASFDAVRAAKKQKLGEINSYDRANIKLEIN